MTTAARLEAPPSHWVPFGEALGAAEGSLQGVERVKRRAAEAQSAFATRVAPHEAVFVPPPGAGGTVTTSQAEGSDLWLSSEQHLCSLSWKCSTGSLRTC